MLVACGGRVMLVVCGNASHAGGHSGFALGLQGRVTG